MTSVAVAALAFGVGMFAAKQAWQGAGVASGDELVAQEHLVRALPDDQVSADQAAQDLFVNEPEMAEKQPVTSDDDSKVLQVSKGVPQGRQDIEEARTAEALALDQNLSALSGASTLEQLKALEKKMRKNSPVLEVATVDAQADTYRFKQGVSVAGGTIRSIANAHSEYQKLKGSEAGQEITQYKGTIDAWQIQNLNVGDRFSLPINNTEQASLQILSRSKDDTATYLVAEPINSQGKASFKLTPTRNGLRFFGTVQRGQDVIDFMSNDGQLLTVIEQSVMKQGGGASY